MSNKTKQILKNERHSIFGAIRDWFGFDTLIKQYPPGFFFENSISAELPTGVLLQVMHSYNRQTLVDLVLT